MIWSFVLSIVGITAMWLAGKGRPEGWALGVLGETLWITYAITTAQYGFLIASLAYGWVFVRNYVVATNNRGKNEEDRYRRRAGRAARAG